jgi:predicted aconitase with swiveling domain
MASTVESTGNFSVATNKFTVAAATGNTVVAGTLGVTGAVTLTAGMDVGTTLTVGGDVTLESADTITNAAGNTIVMTASTAVEFTGGIDVQGGNITLQNDEVIKNDVDGTVEVTSGVFKHAFDAAAYWTATQADAGSVTFASVSDGTPGFAFSQAVTLSDTLGVGGDITLQNTETISNAVNGTVEITSAVFKHAVDAAAYWTATQADAGAVTFASVSDGTPSFTFSQKVLLSGDFDVGSANFTVASASGNVATAGTLDVQGGDITLQNDETIGNSVNGTIDFSAGVLKHAVDALAYWTATQADGGAVTFDSVSDGTPGFTFSDATTFSATMQNAMVITGDTTDRVMVGARVGFGNDAAPADNAPANGCVIYFDGTDIKAVNNAGTTTTLSGAWA